MTVPAALRFTYDDYLLLPEGRQYEIIDGDLFMVPAPVPYHQHVALGLGAALRSAVREAGLGQVLIAPCDVVLSPTDIVQPDVLFVARDRLDIIGDKNITAAPDLVIEVLSPSTAERDQTIKAKLYARAGVKELWIVDPEAKAASVLVPGPDGWSAAGHYTAEQTLKSPLLGLPISLRSIFF